jgi:hypothetical protein
VAAEIHFVQGAAAPAMLGAGDEMLACRCGNILIEGFRPSQFLGVGIQCGRCGATTNTAPLPADRMPPAGLIVAEPSAEARFEAMRVPAGVAVVGRCEMERLGTLLRPNTPPCATYRITSILLDETEAAFWRHTGGGLPMIGADPADLFAGLREHALAWAVRHLRGRIRDGSWACIEDVPTANAVTHVAGFLHFVATWSGHPLFPAMVTTAGDRGFSLHGLALFAAAHSLAMMGNRVGFREPTEPFGRIEGFDLATGATDVIRVHMDVFDRFEFPFGRKWDPAGLLAAVSGMVAAARGRINLRNPGLLLVSPGAALAGYDEALIEAVKCAVQAQGRKNRGLMAVAPIVLRLQVTADPHAVRFGYGLFPISNQHYKGDRPSQIAV